jgi:hypothetical protein
LPNEPQIKENTIFAKNNHGACFSVSLATLEEYDALINPDIEGVVSRRVDERKGGIEINTLYKNGTFKSTRIIKSENFTYCIMVETEEERVCENNRDCGTSRQFMKMRPGSRRFFDSFQIN